jgi:hypothetical protein
MKLPVVQTYIDAFDYCWRERRAAARFALVPFVAVFVLTGLLQAFGINQTAMRTSQPSAGVAAALAVVGLIQLVLYLPMAVSWYRVVVYGAEEAKRRPVFTLGRLEARMLLWQIIIVLAACGVVVVGAAIIGVIYFGLTMVAGKAAATVAAVALAIALVVTVMVSVNRLGLALVLVAADQPVSLKIAWSMTHGVSLRLFALVVLVILTGIALMLFWRLFALLFGMIGAMVVQSTVGTIVPYINLVGQAAGGLLIYLVIGTVFGMLYRMLQGMAATAEAAAPTVRLD